MPLPEGLSPPLLVALAAVWCRLIYALSTSNTTGALVALMTVAAWRTWAKRVRVAARPVSVVIKAPAPEKTATQDEDEEALTIADARRTIERCTTLARADLNDEECDSPRGNFRLVLSFDLAVTPADAFAKFWENDFYARVLEEKCGNEDVSFEPWHAGPPQRRRVNTMHPLAGDVKVPGISFAIPTYKVQRVFRDVAEMAFCIVEESRFEKIPYARALAVETVWLFSLRGSSIFVRLYYRCIFDTTVLSVPKWIQHYCAAHTREELVVTYGKWISTARDLLEAEQGVREARMVDAPRNAPPPSWTGVPTDGWDDVFPETKRWLQGYDANSAKNVSLEEAEPAVRVEKPVGTK